MAGELNHPHERDGTLTPVILQMKELINITNVTLFDAFSGFQALLLQGVSKFLQLIQDVSVPKVLERSGAAQARAGPSKTIDRTTSRTGGNKMSLMAVPEGHSGSVVGQHV